MNLDSVRPLGYLLLQLPKLPNRGEGSKGIPLLPMIHRETRRPILSSTAVPRVGIACGGTIPMNLVLLVNTPIRRPALSVKQRNEFENHISCNH